ncbi:PepSY domain-containing protein [Streptomyces sp. ISL-112]|uniref:PepSY domain-containing protein n=1 Tax=unclassified Streptomyces TaxID=2593676 RepID=UPI001BEAC386|nr:MULTISPECIES: PepSY domain-containing protein [unclassified Streptomyces]MBT2428068.1 PepSY domain-containing protein [Streptomyces sp. ISL-112]MBT2463137.1 PepSY domain-containing protein [Streptomyces sp. ISL-63]
MRLEPRRNNRLSLRSRNLRATGAAACLAAAALLLTACGQSADSATSAATEAAKVLPQRTTASPSATADLTEDQRERKSVLDATKVAFDDAATTAVGEVANGKLVDLDLEGVDDDDRGESPSPTATGSPTGTASPTGSPEATGSPSASPGADGPVWVAEVAEKDGTVHTVRIDAVDGKVIEARVDADQDAEDKKQTAEWLSQATQTPEQAAKVATEKKKGTVTSVSLDDNDGSGVIWSVDVVGSDWKKTTFDVDAKNDTIVREETDND